MRRAAAVAALLMLVASAPMVQAHESDPAVVTVLDSISPQLPAGVRVQVVSSIAAQLLVENTTSTPLQAVAESGEIFVRVSAAGVEGNFGSQAWYDSNAPSGRARTPGGALGAPRFVRVQGEPSWGWFDHRLHPAEVRVTPAVRNAKVRSRLAEWTVPLRYGTTEVTLRGHLEYRPVLGRIVTAITSSSLPSGVEMSSVDGRLPGLFLRNGTGATVRVLGLDGELFAEFWPDAVTVNRESRVHVEDARAKGRGSPAGPLLTDPVIRVSSSPTYSWLDLRLRYTEPAVPDEVQRRRRPTVLVRWTIPVEVSGVRSDVVGTTSFVPFATEAQRPRTPPGTPPAPAVIVAVGALIACVLFVLSRSRRRRRRG